MKDGFQAYQYYMALKLHFTNPSYNVFKTRGRIKGTYEKFFARNDRSIFERLARTFDVKTYIQYIACNFMYDNPDMIYDSAEAEHNYSEYIRRKQSITRVFVNDISTIVNCLESNKKTVDVDLPSVIQLYLGDKITIETMSILNDKYDMISKIKMRPSLYMMLERNLLRVEKSKGFVKYDVDKIDKSFQDVEPTIQELMK